MYSIILSYLIFTSGTAGLTDYLSLYRIITVVNMYNIILSYLIFTSGTAGLTDYLSLYRIITVVNMLLQPHPGPTVNYIIKLTYSIQSASACPHFYINARITIQIISNA